MILTMRSRSTPRAVVVVVTLTRFVRAYDRVVIRASETDIRDDDARQRLDEDVHVHGHREDLDDAADHDARADDDDARGENGIADDA